MTDGSATKTIVQQWFSHGVSTPAALDMVTDDFVWRGTPSLAEIFEHDDATQRGRDGLGRLIFLKKALYANVGEEDHTSAATALAQGEVVIPLAENGTIGDLGETFGDTGINVHFLIAEGDICVMEFDARFTTHDGDPYHNHYCFVIHLRDGKIAEVREHVDTRYVYDVCMGSPAKHAGVMARLADLRAAAAAG